MAKPGPRAKLKPSHPLAQGIVGAWLFNEGAGDTVIDYSGNGNNAIRSSSGSPSETNVFWVNEEPDHQPGWNTVDGATRHALLTVPGSEYKITGALTLVVGIKPPTTGIALQDILVHCSNEDSVTQGYLLQNVQTNGTLRPIWRIQNGEGLANWGQDLSGGYHQIVGTYLPSTHAKIIVDDGTPILDTTGIPAALTYTNVDQLGIGRQDFATARFVECIFYYVYIYNRELTASEITSLFADPYQMFVPSNMTITMKDVFDRRSSVEIALVEIDLPTGTRRYTWADVGANSAIRGHFEPKILDMGGTLRFGLPSIDAVRSWLAGPSFELREINLTINDADTDFDREIDGVGADGVPNAPARIYVASINVPEPEWWQCFTGRLASFSKQTERTWELALRQDDAPLLRPVPKRAVTKSLFPNAPGENLDHPLPIIYGIHDSAGRGSGFVPGILVDNDAHRYAISHHWCKNILRAYKDGAIIPTSAWSSVQNLGLTKGAQIQLVEFTADQEGGEITFDVEGIEATGDGTGTLITNPMTQLEHFLDNFVYSDYVSGNWVTPGSVAPLDASSVGAVEAFMVSQDWEGSRYIAKRDTGQSWVNDWLRSFPLVFAEWTQENKIRFAILDWRLDLNDSVDAYRVDQDRRSSRFEYQLGARDLVRSLFVSYLLDSVSGDFADSFEAREPAVPIEAQERIELTWAPSRFI